MTHPNGRTVIRTNPPCGMCSSKSTLLKEGVPKITDFSEISAFPPSPNARKPCEGKRIFFAAAAWQ